MSLGERIKQQRLAAGLSQEKLAELMDVSRQAVTKWESGKAAPSTEKLFKLAELFGTTVDLLLEQGQESAPCSGRIQAQRPSRQAAEWKKRMKWLLLIIFCYLLIYLIGRLIWCRSSENSALGFLFYADPAGAHSYLFGWLLHSRLFWLALTLSSLPALLGKFRFCVTTLSFFLLGLVLGILFGPYPAGEAYGHGDYGWAIWGLSFLLSIPAGILLEILWKKGLLRRRRT